MGEATPRPVSGWMAKAEAIHDVMVSGTVSSIDTDPLNLVKILYNYNNNLIPLL